MGLGASLVTQALKYPPVTQETRVPSLGREDPPEKGMATHSGILAWKISWTEEPWRATVHGVAKSQTGQSHCLLSTVELSRWGGWKGNLHSFSTVFI